MFGTVPVFTDIPLTDSKEKKPLNGQKSLPESVTAPRSKKVTVENVIVKHCFVMMRYDENRKENFSTCFLSLCIVYSSST